MDGVRGYLEKEREHKIVIEDRMREGDNKIVRE